MPRLLFTKEGPAVWMSHLDLMRTLQRAFRRGGLMLKHSQGYSPHPELSIVLPLSVGVSSVCELADFELEPDCSVPVGEIAARMNPVLPAGIRVLDCYEQGKKAGKLAFLRSELRLTYDQATGNRQQATAPPVAAHSVRHAVPRSDEAEGERISPLASLGRNDRVEALRELFARPSLIVEKHGKKGPVELDVAPMIREVTVSLQPVGAAIGRPPEAPGIPRDLKSQAALVIDLVGSAQNPTLNPLLLVTAIERYLPEYKPDFVQCRRLEVYDADGNVFR